MNNSYPYCIIQFTYSKKGLPDEVKKIAEKCFMRAMNEAIKSLNPHYDEWNEEYDQKYGKEYDNEKTYFKFISCKQNAILNELWYEKRYNVRLFSDDNADIAGKFNYDGKIVIMHKSINFVNEKGFQEYLENA